MPRCFVQFPHPGGEHHPQIDDMAWNAGNHQRKFLLVSGRYRDANGQPGAGQLVVWGEWEAPSRIVKHWPESNGLPRALHLPYWVTPDSREFRQNTDPWIWGVPMIYSNCKQSRKTTLGPRSPTAMQRLSRGSLICFGSTVEGEFRLDTVFVVASSAPWVPIQSQDLNADPAFLSCVADAVATSERDASTQFTLYRGATVDDPVDDMYSFVPAMRTDGEYRRFERPTIRIPGLINPDSTQSPLGCTRPLSVDDIQRAWRSVREQVLKTKLLLGVWFEVPACESR